MGYAEVISLDEVRASKQWDLLREQLHSRFDQWLDRLQEQLPEPGSTLAQVTETVWNLRQDLTGGLTETIITHAHRSEQSRKQAHCSQCDRPLKARPAVARTVETMVGSVQLERPYFYCTACRCGRYPFDEALGLTPGRKQLDVQKAAAQVIIEMPYDEAQTLFSDLTGVAISSERMHTLANQAAEGLSLLDVAPSREEIEQRIAEMSAGRWRRPVLVLGIDGAYVVRGSEPPEPNGRRGAASGETPRASASI
jgi:hypothetical protein